MLSASAPLSAYLLSQLLTLPDSTCVLPMPPVFSIVILLAVGKEEIWGGKFNEVIHKPAVSHLCLFLAGMRSFVHPLGKLRDKVSESSSATHTDFRVLLLMYDLGDAELQTRVTAKLKLSPTPGYAQHKAARKRSASRVPFRQRETASESS